MIMASTVDPGSTINTANSMASDPMAVVDNTFERRMLRGDNQRDLQNKCDQCNFCACDSNCDCIFNKCDQCNFCACDANCDCIPDTLPAPVVTPIWGCDGNGGACNCGMGGDGSVITMNRFYGDYNDEQVMGCGGAFALTGGSLSGQWGGSQDSLAASIGIDFSQGASYYGWEGCCYVCGANLQLAGRLSSGWYCEKDFFSTGIWLKGIL